MNKSKPKLLVPSVKVEVEAVCECDGNTCSSRKNKVKKKKHKDRERIEDYSQIPELNQGSKRRKYDDDLPVRKKKKKHKKNRHYSSADEQENRNDVDCSRIAMEEPVYSTGDENVIEPPEIPPRKQGKKKKHKKNRESSVANDEQENRSDVDCRRIHAAVEEPVDSIGDENMMEPPEVPPRRKGRKRKEQTLVNNPLHSTWHISKEEVQSLIEKGVKVKVGKWSQHEVETLKQNMEEYLKANKLTDPTLLIYRKDFEKETEADRDEFYRTLAKGIDRPIFRVYRRVLRMYDPSNNLGKWSETDAEALLRFHRLYGDKWTKIGKLLGRSGMAVSHKYLIMQKSPGYCKWSEEEQNLLNGAVRAATGTSFSAQITGNINWIDVSKFVGTRTPDQCREKWLRDVCWVDRHGHKDVKWNQLDDVCLIERLYAGDERDENDIDWVKLTKEFSNSPSRQWLILRWSILKKAVPNYTERDYEEILEHLYNVHRPFLKQESCPEEDDIVSDEY